MLESRSNDEDRVLNIVEAPRREFARQGAELSWGSDAGQQFVHSTELLIAIDGGGTRTRCVVFDRIGNILAKTETGPSNHLVMDGKLALRSVADAIFGALQQCGAESKQVCMISAGLAGVDVDGEGLVEATQFLHQLGFKDCVVSADILAAHAGALAGEPGVLALSGTGVAYYGRTTDGRTLKAGGWGPAFSDEGSAYWIGQLALQAAACAYDGRGPHTMLGDLICAAFGLQAFSEILQIIYRSEMPVSLIANLSRTTEVAAAQGDAVALQIFEKAGDELARGVEAVVRKLGFPSTQCQVSWEGATLRNSELVRARFCSTVSALVPGAYLVAPRFDPVHGAYLIGCKSLGWEIATL